MKVGTGNFSMYNPSPVDARLQHATAKLQAALSNYQCCMQAVETEAALPQPGSFPVLQQALPAGFGAFANNMPGNYLHGPATVPEPLSLALGQQFSSQLSEAALPDDFAYGVAKRSAQMAAAMYSASAQQQQQQGWQHALVSSMLAVQSNCPNSPPLPVSLLGRSPDGMFDQNGMPYDLDWSSIASPPGLKCARGGQYSNLASTPKKNKKDTKSSQCTTASKVKTSTPVVEDEAGGTGMTDGTLCDQLNSLETFDSSCIVVVRRINRFGFDSPRVLEAFLSKYGEVLRVLVPHSHVKSRNGGRRLRPSALGFVVMGSAANVDAILAAGAEQSIAKDTTVVLVQIQGFRHRSELRNACKSKDTSDGDEEEDTSVGASGSSSDMSRQASNDSGMSESCQTKSLS
jgi:hypothetical protein